MLQIILFFLLICFHKPSNILAHDREDIVSVVVETGRTTSPTHEAHPPPHSRIFHSQLLQGYKGRTQEQTKGDLVLKKLTYVGKDALSSSDSQSSTLVGEEYRTSEPIPPRTSKLEVTFSKSHVRKYKPGSATLLEPGEIIEKIRDGCLEHFGPVASNEGDKQHTKDHEAIEIPQDVQVFSLEDNRNLRDKIIPQVSALPSIVIFERDVFEEKKALTNISAIPHLHAEHKLKTCMKREAEFERKMLENYKNSHSACCNGCTVS